MKMTTEIGRIINMLQEGKISATEAEQLISAVKGTETESPVEKKGFLGKMLKVRVKSEQNENVSVNIPLGIVKFALKMGLGIAWSIQEANAYMTDSVLDTLTIAI